MNYLKRDDNTQRIFLTESALNVEDILKEKYDYIWDAINDENFILKSPECNLFKELLYDNKVVGFCSYDFSRQFMTVALNNIYILHNFRRKGIFYRELKKIIETHQKPSIVEPTHLIVEILIKYGFAQKINDNIVASAIEFVIPGHNVISDCDRRRTGRDPRRGQQPPRQVDSAQRDRAGRLPARARRREIGRAHV